MTVDIEAKARELAVLKLMVDLQEKERGRNTIS
jgi:hypothetical protein